MLLEKMRSIMTERQNNEAEPFVKGSLNREFRKQHMLKIMGENDVH